MIYQVLCGKRSCPRVCVRVCHCPAGLARSRQLLAMQRNRREMSQPRTFRLSALSPDYLAKVDFTSEARHHFGVLNQPKHKHLAEHYPTHNYHYAALPFTRVLRPFTSFALLIGFMVALTIVLVTGYILNGANLVPHYEPTPVNYPPYEWMWEN